MAKYRQPGYQDSGEDRQKRESSPRPASKRDQTFGPRHIQMPGTRTVSRCSQCGTVLPDTAAEKCAKCGFELHSCKQCSHFDPSSRFECTQPIPDRVTPKDKRNQCTFYSMRVMIEKETSTPVAQKPSDARQAFENLFKK